MEDLEESDGDAYDDDELQVELPENSRFISNDDQMESIGETNPTISSSQPSMTKGDCCSPILTPNKKFKIKHESLHFTGMDSVDSSGSASSSSCLEPKVFDSAKSMDGNQHQFGSMRNFELTDTQSLKMTENISAYSSPFSLNGKYAVKQEPTTDSEKPPDIISSNFSCREANFVNDKQSMDRNPYLTIQEASDEISLVAYRLVGRMLNEFVQIEGLEFDVDNVSYLKNYDPSQKKYQVAGEKSSCDEDECGSVLIQLVEELMPSFSESGKERLKELMGLR